MERVGRSGEGPMDFGGKADVNEDEAGEDDLVEVSWCNENMGCGRGGLCCACMGFEGFPCPLLSNPSIVSLNSLTLEEALWAATFGNLRSHYGGLFTLFPMPICGVGSCLQGFVALLFGFWLLYYGGFYCSSCATLCGGIRWWYRPCFSNM
ncbi:hypothetical protein SUGI_0056180 [Cryptomeria japonica]|nr:hypothetical protein SUGI_0056180 [Cryptomeria japonica]